MAKINRYNGINKNNTSPYYHQVIAEKIASKIKNKLLCRP